MTPRSAVRSISRTTELRRRAPRAPVSATILSAPLTAPSAVEHTHRCGVLERSGKTLDKRGNVAQVLEDVDVAIFAARRAAAVPPT
jgi:hypothetical protein